MTTRYCTNDIVVIPNVIWNNLRSRAKRDAINLFQLTFLNVFQNLATRGDSMSNISRYSVPVFPSSPFHADTPVLTDSSNEPHQDQCQLQQPHQTSDAVDTRRCQQINRLRPHSVCVPSATARAGSSSSITDSAAVMRRSMSMESLSPRLESHSSKSFESVINELQTALCILKNQLPQLTLLADQVDRLAELLKVNVN